jgi:hypothetical protein
MVKRVFIRLGLVLILLVLVGLTYFLLTVPTGQSQILDSTLKGAIIGAGAAIRI